MRQFTWDEYYNSFYDWSLSTQKNYSYGITNYGSADEVFEILSEFAFYDKKFASRFADKAIDAGVNFTPEQVLEIEGLIDKTVLSKMAEHVSRDFTEEELEEIYMLIDDDVFNRICEKQGVDIFSGESENSSYIEQDYDTEALLEEAPAEIPKKKKRSPSCLRSCWQLQDPQVKIASEVITENVMGTAQTVRLTTDIGMAAGIMDMVM